MDAVQLTGRRSPTSLPPSLLLLASMTSVQFGSAFATRIFAQVGPAGVTLLRVALTAVVLTVTVRPTVRGRTRRELAGVAGYGVNLAVMNWIFYEALHRLPLGVAVTIELTGPLAVAVAGSRRLLDGLWVLLAAAGVGLLALHGGHAGVHPAGVVLALGAAACWANYILLAKQVTRSFAATEALALGTTLGALIVAPAGVIEGGSALLHPAVLGSCAVVALLSSLVPYTLELVAIRRLTTSVFGLLMSMAPAVAALAGVVVLGQHLTLVLGAALVLVVTASVGTTVTAPGERVDGLEPVELPGR